MSAAKTNGSTELQYTVPKRNILLAYICLIEFCECQQGHRKQRNLTDVLHAGQWSTAMLYPYLLKWNIFPTWFFYSASSCFHIVTNIWAVPVWLMRPAHRTGYPNSPSGNVGLTGHKGHWAQVPVKLIRAALSVFWNDFQPFHTSLHKQCWPHPAVPHSRKMFHQVLQCWLPGFEQTGCFYWFRQKHDSKFNSYFPLPPPTCGITLLQPDLAVLFSWVEFSFTDFQQFLISFHFIMKTPRYLCVRILAVPPDVQDARLEEDTEEEIQRIYSLMTLKKSSLINFVVCDAKIKRGY